jgi:hypothetical protein
VQVSSWRKRAIATLTAGLVLTGACLAVDAPAAGAAGSNKLTVKAGEYTYEFSGKPKAGLTDFEFVNDGIEIHMVGLVPLKKNVTARQLTEALMSDDDESAEAIVRGNPEFAPQPGLLGSKQRMGTLLNLSAGRWGVFCFVPAPDGASHVEHGMVKTFDVASGKSSLKAPKDGVTDVTLTDTSVTIPNDALPRKGYLKVTNEGTAPRTWTIAKLGSGVTIEQADAYFDQLFNGAAPEGEPPAVLAGGVQGLAPNASVYLVVDFAAGNYGYENELSDADEDPNSVLGGFTVK